MRTSNESAFCRVLYAFVLMGQERYGPPRFGVAPRVGDMDSPTNEEVSTRIRKQPLLARLLKSGGSGFRFSIAMMVGEHGYTKGLENKGSTGVHILTSMQQQLLNRFDLSRRCLRGLMFCVCVAIMYGCRVWQGCSNVWCKGFVGKVWGGFGKKCGVWIFL